MSEKRKILVIEDAPRLLELYSQLLDASGYTPLTATTGKEGLEIYGKTPGISVVILDMVLPGMNGDAVLAEIQKVNPEQPVIICSGYDIEPCQGNVRILKKPFITPVLLELIEESASGA